jgi:hypothetical protein
VSLFGGFGIGASITPGGGAKPKDIKNAIDALKAIAQRVRFKKSLLEGVPYTRLNCIAPFSVQDFDFCLGRITSARVGAGPVAYGPTYISAAPITVLNVACLAIWGSNLESLLFHVRRRDARRGERPTIESRRARRAAISSHRDARPLGSIDTR